MVPATLGVKTTDPYAGTRMEGYGSTWSLPPTIVPEALYVPPGSHVEQYLRVPGGATIPLAQATKAQVDAARAAFPLDGGITTSVVKDYGPPVPVMTVGPVLPTGIVGPKIDANLLVPTTPKQAEASAAPGPATASLSIPLDAKTLAIAGGVALVLLLLLRRR